MLAAIFGSCSMVPPPSEPQRLKGFVFDVVEFRDMLIRKSPKQWALTLADVRIVTTQQQLSFKFNPSPEDPRRLIEVDISGPGFERRNFDAPDCNQDRSKARLEKEAWIQPQSIQSRSVECGACFKEVVFYTGRPDYDMMSWQDHRNCCRDIKHRIKSSILSLLLPRVRELIYPPNSKDPIELPPLDVSMNLLKGHPEIREFARNQEAVKSLLAMYS